MADLTLFCFVDGDSSAFPVDISLMKTVGHLKDAIKKKTSDLSNVDANKLTLWKSEIPLVDAMEDVTLFHNVIDSTPSLEEDADISAVFPPPEGAPKWNLHIIVQRPPPGNAPALFLISL